MHLINTSTEHLKLEYFQNSTEVPYGVLSHRWSHNEITHQLMLGGDMKIKDKHSGGYDKIVKACQEARKEGLSYMWVDTCCIDKTSSAELSEAINSMFAWYRGARTCYAYLNDVDTIEDLERSVWFTRGWTLQELIAPRKVKFFNKNWKSLGTKDGLKEKLSGITGIPTGVLDGTERLRLLSVAQRMSWAAKRQTTRLEDRAYSLIGIFDIYMPLLYGEGNRAFLRLQEEIIKQSNDHSIFAWNAVTDCAMRDGDDTDEGNALGLLARSPEAFADCSKVKRREPALHVSPYTIINLGLSIRLPLVEWTYGYMVAFLNCVDYGPDPSTDPYTIGILLQQLVEPEQYVRVVLNGQDRVLFEAGVLDGDKKNRIHYKEEPDLVEAIFSHRTVQGPLILKKFKPTGGVLWDYSHKVTDLFVRQCPLDFGRLKPPKAYGYWIRRFTPYQKDRYFDKEKDFKIRCWSSNAWDFSRRRALVPIGCHGEACRIHVRSKRIRLPEISGQESEDKDAQHALDMPPMILRLGFQTNDQYNPTVGIKDDPTEEGVAILMAGPKSDAEVLNKAEWNAGGVQAQGMENDRKRFSMADKVRKVCVSLETIDGSEIRVVDLLWCGPQSQCDECSKVLSEWQVCCVSCESPQYDCCPECFKDLPKTQHDAKPGNEKHLFRAVKLQNGVWRSPLDKHPRLLSDF